MKRASEHMLKIIPLVAILCACTSARRIPAALAYDWGQTSTATSPLHARHLRLVQCEDESHQRLRECRDTEYPNPTPFVPEDDSIQVDTSDHERNHQSRSTVVMGVKEMHLALDAHLHRPMTRSWQQMRDEGTGLEVIVGNQVTIILDKDRRAVHSAQRAAYRFSAGTLRRLGKIDAADLLDNLADFDLDDSPST